LGPGKGITEEKELGRKKDGKDQRKVDVGKEKELRE